MSSRGVQLIATERDRQQRPVGERLPDGVRPGEGYGRDHDRGHTDELALAASCYAIPARLEGDRRSRLWPWDRAYWKPGPRSSRDADERVRELVKAGALIAAAIDDILDRGAR